MKVHPVLRNRDAAFGCGVSGALICRHKKLRRLPHVFAKVLELPFHSDTDVSVFETTDSLRFVVSTDDVGIDVRAQIVEIHPGVSKIVIRGSHHTVVGDLFLDELELDMWRFRLPASTCPDLATAAYRDGELVVLVPKGEDVNNGGHGGAVQLVAVQ